MGMGKLGIVSCKHLELTGKNVPVSQMSIGD